LSKNILAAVGKGVKPLPITDVRIRRIMDDGKMKAVATLTFDDEFVVHDIRIVEGQNGLFVSMPSRRTAEGGYRDIAHPITAEARQMIHDIVLRAYHDAIGE